MIIEHTNEILLLHIIKSKSSSFCTRENYLEQYKKQPGVWSMWAKDAYNADICLEVAQTMDIYDELNYDLSYLEKDCSNGSKNKRYAARKLFEFQKNFAVYECDLNRTCAKYRDIASNYSDIWVYLIYLDETREERERVELEYAVDNKALYWNACCKQRKDAKNYYQKRLQLDAVPELLSMSKM